MACWAKEDMWRRSLHFVFPDSCLREKAEVGTTMATGRKTHLGEKSAPSQESGVHEDREQQVKGFVKECRSAGPRPGSKIVPKERGNAEE
jgi:hypothetical protein